MEKQGTNCEPGQDRPKQRWAGMILSLRFGRSRLLIQLGTADVLGTMGYNPRKAAQVIAYFALKTGQRSIDLIKAMKLVYLSDRERIARWGEPILHERRIALPNGPANDLTYAYAKGERRDPTGWSAFLQERDGNDLPLADDITEDDLDELSDADIEALDAVWDRVGFMRPMALCGWTHKQGNVPEWQDPQGSSRTIPLASIMKEVGVSDPAEAARDVEQRRTLAELLGDA